jgi:hypothetical protein
MHLYVPEDVAQRLRARARARRMPVSRLLAEIIKRELGDGWPEGYFECVVGGWSGEPLERPAQGEPDARLAL